MPLPRATYRLQFHKGFGFDDAARIAPYLSRLGISHVYASPFLKARPGSMHGYDIVAHDQLNPELGDEAAFMRMVDAFKAHGLKQILDIVPNHMGVGGADNPLWLDVLEWGLDSRYAGWFDIEWEPHSRYLVGKILVPFLGDQYGVELEAGNLRLKFDEQNGEFAVWAYDTHKLPICPVFYETILGDSHAELEYLADDFAAIREWHPQVGRRAIELKQQLANFINQNSNARLALMESLAHFNAEGQAGSPRRELDALIQQQNWRATNFRVAGDDVNYRRFFNVNELAGLRIELPDVFEHAHQLVLQLLRRGILDGLRIDHIDGLLDPLSYLNKLRAAIDENKRNGSEGSATYLVVEKILSHGEALPAEWPVDGTTGYEFCNLALGVLIDQRSDMALTHGYEAFTGRRQPFAQIVRDSKIRIMSNEMAGELNVLARSAARVARQTPRTADFTRNILLRAIRELIACFPVYRTYLDNRGSLNDAELQAMHHAIDQARIHEWEIDSSVFDFLEKLLSGKLIAPGSGFIRHTVLRCAMNLQQYSGPVMAKGLEDTAFYRFNRFIALNEVGGSPGYFGLGLDEFHAANTKRAQQWPNSMLCTSTHDTKRGEDTRARLAVITEIPDEWLRQANAWLAALSTQASPTDIAPDPNDVYLLFQLLLGACPAEVTLQTSSDAPLLANFRTRLTDVMRKSLREAKVRSTWTKPNEAYEEQVLRLVDMALRPERSPTFWQAFVPFLHRVASLGVQNSLVQTVLKLTVPGVPDIYQGCEGWNLSMVDPDNRRPVDFDTNAHLLNEIVASPEADRSDALAEYLANWHDGRIKMAVTHAVLQFRREHAELFAGGSYTAIAVEGARADEVCAFARRLQNQIAIVVVTRFPARREAGVEWGDTRLRMPFKLEQATLKEVIGSSAVEAAAELPLAKLLNVLPVAILTIS